MSLGLHVPAGLRYLITEGIAPATTTHKDYKLQLYPNRRGDETFEEEVLAFEQYVIWSRGGAVRSVYSFELEGEPVRQAFLTQFAEPVQHQHSRALVVLLTTKVHIYMLHGSHHVVDLPFPIERAFPISHGLLFQRAKVSEPIRNTPEPPGPPHNSFFSSQPQMSSFLQSPTVQRSLGMPQSSQPIPGQALLDSLWNNLQTKTDREVEADEDMIFSLVSPLAELGLVVQARPAQSRLLIRPATSTKNAFESIDPSEEVVFVWTSEVLLNEDELLLIVTLNKEQQTLTLWHGWYLKERTLDELMKQQKQHQSDKNRRRSSFLSTIATGTTTPAVRTRDRESLVQGSRLRAHSSQTTDAFASQLDDLDDDGSQTVGREDSRRISSIVSRGELFPADQRTGAGPSFRRSMGLNDRRSFGHRRSRASTPGRSYYEEDMDLDSDTEKDESEVMADALDEIKATYESTNAGFFAGILDDGWKQDLVIRRVHTMNGGAQPGHYTVTRIPPFAAKEAGGTALRLSIVNTQAGSAIDLDIEVRFSKLYNTTASFAIPLVKRQTRRTAVGHCIKLTDGDTEAVLDSKHGLVFPSSDHSTSLSARKAYLVNNPLATLEWLPQDSNIGKHRTLQASQAIAVDYPGIHGTFSETDADGLQHRRQIQIAPRSALLQQVLEICELVLPDSAARMIRSTWYVLHSAITSERQSLVGTVCSPAWLATIASIFSLVLDLIDQKGIAAAKVAHLARKKDSPHSRNVSLHQSPRAQQLFTRGPWVQLDKARSINTSDQALLIALALADEHKHSLADRHASCQDVSKLMLALHLLREEHKLNVCQQQNTDLQMLAVVIAQLGHWLGQQSWSYDKSSYYNYEGASESTWAFVHSSKQRDVTVEIMESPIGVMEWLEHSLRHKTAERYPTMNQVAGIGSSTVLTTSLASRVGRLTPRTTLLSDLLETTNVFQATPTEIVEAMTSSGISCEMLEGLPTGVAAPCQEAISQCERSPPSSWSRLLLKLVGREDLDWKDNGRLAHSVGAADMHDVSTICTTTEQPPGPSRTREADRNAISQLIFHEDRRLVHAASILHFNTVQLAECAKQPEWTDAYYFEQQRRVMQYVNVRTIALPTGDAMLHYASQSPLMTERYHLPGFSSSCIMQPMGHTVTTERSGLTEDKVSWAYFHAGVSTGLKISKTATGIDTSWLVFNKPNELTNRHAGLLLALGLNGHLRHIAKWLSFKYLTPKHAMTSLGLLLGLSASNIGTMDSLITRMLSVHITCMLPLGAAELNVSPLTQTAGLLGIGLLYHNTQHRRMSDTMLHEIETMSGEDPDNGPDLLRDESYRLAAGLALGLINLGRGRATQSLHGMQLEARLLRMAVGARPVKAVHVFDRATAGAIMGLSLVFMKTGDQTLARKVDVPATEQQYEYIRPDMLMLRAMAKHLIMWSTIDMAQTQWIHANIPACCKSKWIKFQRANAIAVTADLPFFYILTGLAWAVSLRYAGSGNTRARDEILEVLDMVWQCLRRRSDGNLFYDAKSARTGLRRCVDALSVFAAVVMAGTGDVQTFRYLRRLHGKTDAETLYGSHLASHMGIGVLFLGGGTLTLGTSSLAIAALVCSTYPLFPTDVQDNRVHLQAFRHLWVFAVEARCLVVEDIDTGMAVRMLVTIRLKSGESKILQTPCLLPDFDTVASLTTEGVSHWPVHLDFSIESARMAHFRSSQKIYVKHCPPSVMYDDIFWSTFAAALAKVGQLPNESVEWILRLPTISRTGRQATELTAQSMEHATKPERVGMKADDQLVLNNAAASNIRDRLWDVRVLLAWTDQLPEGQQKQLRWLSWQFIHSIKAQIEERRKAAKY